MPGIHCFSSWILTRILHTARPIASLHKMLFARNWTHMCFYCLFICLCWEHWGWTQGLKLYTWTMPSDLLCLVCFSARVSHFFPWAGLRFWLSYLSLPCSWNYRHTLFHVLFFSIVRKITGEEIKLPIDFFPASIPGNSFFCITVPDPCVFNGIWWAFSIY